MKYDKPLLLAFNVDGTAVGACANGSGDLAGCRAGAAPGQHCQDGANATGNPHAGCKNGSVAAHQCKAGTSPGK